ncbi:MAG: putative rane associated protease [Phycisphaerales bacterium]|nr:putative rane associated protease [Phycisphaerales bacterium]MDB5354711.1 putative rane associated protease [Phycisphaerales bacterium]
MMRANMRGPPFIPPYYVPAPLVPPRREFRLSAAIAWLVILVSVGLVAGMTWERARGPEPDVTAPAATASTPLKLTSRYAVGIHSMFPSIAGANAKTLADQVEKAAVTTVDKLREVPVVGELEGAKAALRKLDALPKSVDNPDFREDAQTLRLLYSDGVSAVPEDRAQALVAREGWFGHLALGYGQGASDPHRRVALAAAKRTVITLWSALGLVFGTFLVGLVLLIIALVLLVERRVALAYRPTTEDTQPFLEAFAIYVGGYVGLSLALRFLHPGGIHFYPAYLLLLMLLPPVAGAFWPRLRGVPPASWRYGLGWHAGRGVLREIGAGIGGYIAGVPVVILGGIITLVLTAKTGAKASHPIVNESGGVSKAIELYFLACVYAPLVEETMFRGALFHRLRSRWSWLFSTAVVSILFAAMHPQGWAGVPVLASIAIVLAAIREWRGTILASATAHALNNGFAMTMLVLAAW